LKARSSTTDFAGCNLTNVPERQFRVHALLGMYYQRTTPLVALAGKPDPRKVKRGYMESLTFTRKEKVDSIH
jgi:hypothetical protein